MERPLGPFVLGLAILCAVPGLASAQSISDLKGTWTGTSKTIVSGQPLHHPASTPSQPAGPNRLTEIKITLTIEGQQDGRFWGKLGSPATVEPVIGVLSPDGKRLRAVPQSGGVIEGTALSADSFELFYFENKAGTSVAATNVLSRQK